MKFAIFCKAAVRSWLVAACLLTTTNAATAQSLVSSVARLGGESTFRPPDRREFGAVDFFPSYYLRPGPKGQNATVGLNIRGGLRNLGNFKLVGFFYEVNQDVPSLNPDLRILIQTSDGFTRQSIVTDNQTRAFRVRSRRDPVLGAITAFTVDAQAEDFTPSFRTNSIPVETIVLQYFGTHTFRTQGPEIITQRATLIPKEFTFRMDADTAFLLGN